MADYTGVEYDPNFFRGDDEALTEYMDRLAGLRKGGILGIGTNETELFDGSNGITLESAQEEQAPKLGEASYACPVGYNWDPISQSCVKDGDTADVYDPKRDFLESRYGKTLAEGIGAEEAWKAKQAQMATDRLTGRAPTLSMMDLVLPTGTGLLMDGLKSDEERAALKEGYFGSEDDMALIAADLAAGGMAQSEIERLMGDRESLARAKAMGLAGSPGTRGYEPDKGVVGTMFGDLLSNISGIGAHFNTPDYMDKKQANIYQLMPQQTRQDMYGSGRNPFENTGYSAIPSYALLGGNNFDTGMFSQSYTGNLGNVDNSKLQQRLAAQASEAAQKKAALESQRIQNAANRVRNQAVSYPTSGSSSSNAGMNYYLGGDVTNSFGQTASDIEASSGGAG